MAPNRRATAALLLALGACTPSSTIPEQDRAAPAADESIAWRPATREDVVGYFESERVTGEAAASLRKVYYENALRHLPSLKASIDSQRDARRNAAAGN